MRPSAIALSLALVFGLACTGGGMDTAKPLTPATDPAEPPEADATAADAEEGAAEATDGSEPPSCCAGPADCDGCPPSYSDDAGECAGTVTSGPECEPVCCGFYDEPGASNPSEKTSTLRGNCIASPPHADAKVLNTGACAAAKPATKKTSSTSMSGAGADRPRARTRTGAAAGAGGGRVNRGASGRRAATTAEPEETTEEATEETTTESTGSRTGGRRPNR